MEKGQIKLVKDLQDLLTEASDGEFGDFSNNKYPTPKLALIEKFNILGQNVKNGKYDEI